jgi:hypothetical protein
MSAIFPARRLAGFSALLVTICFSGCGKKAQPVFATLTMKDGGSHFSGTVVRQEKNSITLIGPDGNPRTFLYTELAGPIQYGAPNTADAEPDGQSSPASSSVQGQSATGQAAGSKPVEVTAAVTPGGDVSFPIGTEFPVRITGFLDSCCLPPGAMTLGRMDADLKGSNGKIAIPAGSNIVFDVVSTEITGGEPVMVFRISSADFGGHHYIVDPGAEVTFTGPKAGTPAAKIQGARIHLQDQTFMGFKAVKPVTFHLSK